MKRLLAVILLTTVWSVSAQEIIENYDVEIEVMTDRSIRVTEEITVKVEGVNISRGLFRDIKDVLVDDDGKKYRYFLDVEQVLRDGNEEPYSVSRGETETNIRIGEADVLLEHRNHTYTIVYTMRGQVRFFVDFDELYWNAIAQYWEFPIREGSVLVKLPQGAEIIELNGYTGGYGESTKQVEPQRVNNTTATFVLTSPLDSKEGLSVSVTWNKGVIAEATPEQMAEDRVELVPEGRYTIYYLYGGIIIIFLYYYLIWRRVGVDPKKGAIIPRWEVPGDLSAGPVRYIKNMGYDNEVFASSIISLAIKRHIDISKEKKKFTLTRIKHEKAQPLSTEEMVILEKLFGSSYKSIEVDQANHRTFGNALSAYRKDIKKKHKKRNFSNNYGWIVPGILLSFAVLILSMAQINDPTLPVFFVILALQGVFLIGIFMAKKWVIRIVMFVFAGFMAIPILVIYSDLSLDLNVLVPFIPGLLGLGIINYIFFFLLPAPTVAGRRLMDEIEGLKMYMKTAEKERLDLMNPPEEDLQLFEKLFPYALALGVEQKWSRKFEKMLDRIDYSPEWYHGDFNRAHMAVFSASLGSSFASSLSTASTSPQSSSSSGSGGGGFSGGGGGGGGGGGW